MFKNKKIFVLGMGKSGCSVARLLACDNHVLITDVKCDDLALMKELENLKVNVIITKNQDEILDNSYDFVVKNPGIRLDHPAVEKAQKLNIPIITELEVAYRYLPKVQIVGITGSNGKTTTTMIAYEFLKTAQKLTKRPDIFGVSFEEDLMFYLPFLMSEGGGVLSDDLSKNIINDEKSQKGLRFYADLRKKYHAAPLKSESASATTAQMFLQGRLGMQISGRWLVPKYREEANFDWDIAPFPKGAAGSVVPLDSSGWAVAKSSKHKSEAVLLIKYLSSKENIEKMTESGLIVPARIDAANSKYFLDDKKPLHAKVFLDVIKTSKPTPVSVNYNEVTDKMKTYTEKLFN